MTKQLTDEQRVLAEDNIGLAIYMTNRYCGNCPFEWDELLSIFFEILVKCALNFKPEKQQGIDSKKAFAKYASRAMKSQLSREYQNLKRQTLSAFSFEELTNDFDKVTSWEKYIGNGKTPVDEYVIGKINAEKLIENYKGSPSETKAVIIFISNPYLSHVKIANQIGISQPLVSSAISKLRKQLQTEMAS